MHYLFTADFIDLDNVGGAGRVVVELASRLAAAGHTVSVLAGGAEGGRRVVTPAGAPLDWISFPYRTDAGRGLGYYMQLKRLIPEALRRAEIAPDCVIHNQPVTGGILRGLPVPAFYLFHSPWPLEYVADRFSVEDAALVPRHHVRARIDVGLRRYLEKRAIAPARRVFTLSRVMQRFASSLHGIPEERITVIPGGVDRDRFHPGEAGAREAARRRFDIAPDETILVTVRRLVARTGVDLLLDALRRAFGPAEGRLKRTRLLVAGKGPETERLHQRVREIGLGGRVRFLGYVPEDALPELYRAADLAVMPTKALEGFGLSTLEALACGTPVVATPVGGSVEILERLDPRLLAAAVAPDALGSLLLDWCTDRASLDALRPACRPFVENHYSWGKMATGMTGAIADEVRV